MDRNRFSASEVVTEPVALRKESVDRNRKINTRGSEKMKSLSARRAWIEIRIGKKVENTLRSLSARRAWIEIFKLFKRRFVGQCRSPQGERG